MGFIQLHTDCPTYDTCVPNIFIDKYMPEANGEFVKVYLYLLRCMNSHASNISISAIADCFDHTEKDVVRALKYWERAGLINLEFAADKSISSICFCRIDSSDDDSYASAKANPQLNKTVEQTASVTSVEAPKADNQEQVAAPVINMPSVPARREYSLDEMKVFQSNEEITELIFVIESYLKRNLTTTDLNAIFYWYDSLHFSSELIDYLVQYCVSKGHSSARYMDKVAIGWHESGIRTIDDAKANAAIHSQAFYGVMKAFGITGRSLVENEKAFIKSWTKEYNFELPIIQEACSKTISATHQPSFEYCDKILRSWFEKGVHTLDDVRKLDELHTQKKRTVSTPVTAVKKNKFTNFPQREYDYEQLETMLLNTNV